MDICIYITESLYSTPITNTALYINYTSKKKIFFNLKKKKDTCKFSNLTELILLKEFNKLLEFYKYVKHITLL